MAKKTISIGGPFYGLDARSDDRLTGTSYAKRAENVVVQDGDIRARPGIGLPLGGFPPVDPFFIKRVFYLVTPDTHETVTVILANKGAGKDERKFIFNSASGLIDGDIHNQDGGWESPSMVAANGMCYIFDRGHIFPVLTNGQTGDHSLIRVGPPLGQNYDPPGEFIVTDYNPIPLGNIPEPTSDPSETGFFDWAFTLFDSVTGTETSLLFPKFPDEYEDSQVLYSPLGPVLFTAPFDAVIDLTLSVDFNTVFQFDKIGIYRRHHDIDGGVFFFCKYVDAPTKGGTTVVVTDDVPNSERDMTKTVPTRHNYPPPGVSTGVYHLGRMWVAGRNQPDNTGGIYGEEFDPSLVYWSETNNAGHFFLTNFLRMGAHGEAVTALVVFRGNLIVFKERTIHVLVGDAPVWTNESDALGIPPLAPTFSPYVADSVRGMPSPKAGHHGVIDVDNKLWFMGESGPMTFDGSPSVDVAPRLRGIFKITENTEVGWAVDEEMRLLALRVDNASMVPQYSNTVFLFAYEAMTPEGVPRITTMKLDNAGLSLSGVHQGYMGGGAVQGQAARKVIYIEAAETADQNELYRFDKDNNSDGASLTPIEWSWVTAMIHAGKPGRRKRWHFLTLEQTFVPEGKVRIDVFADNFPSEINTKDLEESGMVKLRLGQRAKHIQLDLRSRSEGDLNDVGGITAVVLEATDIDRR